MATSPQLLVTLSPFGGLQVELPGANGLRRKVELAEGAAESILLRMLLAQQVGASPALIGMEAAPTQWDVDAWVAQARKIVENGTAVHRYSTPRSGAPAVKLPDQFDDIGL